MKVKNTHVVGYNKIDSYIIVIYELEDGSYIKSAGSAHHVTIDENEFNHWITKDSK